MDQDDARFKPLNESLCGDDDCLAVCRNINKSSILLGSADGILKRIVKDQIEQIIQYQGEIQSIDTCNKYILIATSSGLFIIQNKRVIDGTEVRTLPIDIQDIITSVSILNYDNQTLSFVYGTQQGQINYVEYETSSNAIREQKILNNNQCIHQLYIASYNNIKYIVSLTYQNMIQVIEYTTEAKVKLQFQIQDSKFVEGTYNNIQYNFIVIQDNILIVSNNTLYVIDITGRKEEYKINIQKQVCQLCHLTIEKQHILVLIGEYDIYIGLYQQNNDEVFKELQHIQLTEEDNKKIVDFNYYQIQGDQTEYLWYQIVINESQLVKNIEQVNIDINSLLQDTEIQPIQEPVQQIEIKEEEKKEHHMISKIQSSSEEDLNISEDEKQKPQLKQEQEEIKQEEEQILLPHQQIVNKLDYQKLIQNQNNPAKFQLSTQCVLPMSETTDINEQYNYDTQSDLIDTLSYYNKLLLVQNAYGNAQLSKNNLTIEFTNPDIPVQQIKSTRGQIISCDLKQNCFCYLTPLELRSIFWNNNDLEQISRIQINDFIYPIQCAIGNTVYQSILYDSGNVDAYENSVKIFTGYFPGAKYIQMQNNILLIVTEYNIKLYDVFTQHKLFEGENPCEECTFCQLDEHYNIFLADEQNLYMSSYMSGIESVQINWILLLEQKAVELKRINELQQQILSIEQKAQQGEQNTTFSEKDVNQLLPVYKLIQYVIIDKFQITIYYIPVTQDEEMSKVYLKLKNIQQFKQQLKQLCQSDIQQLQDQGFIYTRACPQSILSLDSIESYQLTQNYLTTLQILNNARSFRISDDQMLEHFDKLSIQYALELYKQNNQQGAKFPLSKIQLKSSLDKARQLLSKAGSNELQDYCLKLYYDTYEDEEDYKLEDQLPINIGTGRMLEQDQQNVDPIFLQRVDEFGVIFNNGGKMQLQKWEKDVKVELQKQIKQQYEELLKQKPEIKKQSQSVIQSPQKVQQEKIEVQEKELPKARPDGNKRFLEQLGNKKVSSTPKFEPKNPTASPIKMVTTNSLFGNKQ